MPSRAASLLPRRRHGFTLVEALIVVTLVALMAALVVPSLTGIDRRRARLAVDEVEDVVRAYAYRDATTAQQVALLRDPDSGAIGLWVKDIDPEDINAPAEWRPDTFTPGLLLPDAVVVSDVRIDGRRQNPGNWIVTRAPGQPRPTFEIDLVGDDVRATISLLPEAVSPIRFDPQGQASGWREPVDLDAVGRDREQW